MVKKISISIPEELFKNLSRLSKSTNKSRSSIIVEALKAYISIPEEPIKPDIYPTALWKLRNQSFIKLRSPKLAMNRIKSDWIIESEV
ncbi:MAG: ribbon-helix-helix protein, CopG family [Nitrososphaerota archaeon]